MPPPACNLMAAENGERDWQRLARAHTRERAQALLFFSLLQVFTSSQRQAKRKKKKSEALKKRFWVLIRGEKAYEFKQSTTMFFHRFLVPTMVMMHFLLGLM